MDLSFKQVEKEDTDMMEIYLRILEGMGNLGWKLRPRGSSDDDA